VLVVAHNAVNQALVGSALGLGPEHFRRLLQSNGGATVVDFWPGTDGGAPARASLDRLNETAPGALTASLAKADAKTLARVVLVRPEHSDGAAATAVTPAAALAATLAPALAAGARVAAVLHCPEDSAAAAEIARSLVAAGGSALMQQDDDLAPPRAGEARAAFWRRCGRAWRRAVAAAEAEAAAAAVGSCDARPPALVVVVSSSAGTLAAVVGHALSSEPDADEEDGALGPQARACLGGGLRFRRGSATVVDLAAREADGRPPSPAAVVRTLNASLGDIGAERVARRGESLPGIPELVAFP